MRRKRKTQRRRWIAQIRRSSWDAFWRGFVSAFDLFGVMASDTSETQIEHEEDGIAGDYARLGGDWANVGGDMRRAMKKVNHET